MVIAAHADEALGMLADPSDAERRLLGPWVYQPNDTVLHTDASVMPPSAAPGPPGTTPGSAARPRRAGRSSYWMNRLQGLQTRTPLFVSLNRRAPLAADRVVMRTVYHHPTYSREALAAQGELPALNGKRRTWYCGSYFGYGFHEDAVRSAVELVRASGWTCEIAPVHRQRHARPVCAGAAPLSVTPSSRSPSTSTSCRNSTARSAGSATTAGRWSPA